MTFHASGIVAMAALRSYPILITAGEDGALHAYNSETHDILAKYQFQTAITCMLYPPLDVRKIHLKFFLRQAKNFLYAL